jgi:tRNA-dihydrouridine synthase A
LLAYAPAIHVFAPKIESKTWMAGLVPRLSGWSLADEAHGVRLHSITRHFVGAFHGVPGARAFRRHLAENGVWPGAGVDVLREAIARVEDRIAAPIAA